MLSNAARIHRVIVGCGYTDLRKGINGLAQVVKDTYELDPLETGTLFLFCGKRTDRIKGLLWMGNGFLMLYKRWEAGSLSWPRTPAEAAEITEAQFYDLMRGFNSVTPKVRDVHPDEIY